MTAPEPLTIEIRERAGVTVVRPRGVLDLVAYAKLRDILIKCALEVPRAVVVDLNALHVPTMAHLAVFSTVWLRVSQWPGVPIMLVLADPEDRHRLARAGVDRHLPIHADLATALRGLNEPAPRQRATASLADSAGAACQARLFVGRTCRRWGCPEQIAEDAVVVANALVDNAVRHAQGNPTLRLELRVGRLTVAVYDDGPVFVPPGRDGATVVLGLGLTLVDGLAMAWGCAPAADRKVVWAVLQPA